MIKINKSDILASPDKAFAIASDAIKADYTKDTALDFFNTYKDQSLSFILDRSYDIVKEAYYGFDFILDISKKHILTPLQLDNLAGVTKQISKEASNYFAPKEQIEKYNQIADFLTNKLNQLRNIGKLYTLHGENTWYVGEYAKFIFDILYSAEKDQDKDAFKSCISKLYEIEDPYIFFAIAPFLLAKYPEYTSGTILENTKRFYKSYDHSMIEPELKNSLKTVKALRLLREDDFVIHSLEHCANRSLYELWTSIMMTDISDIDKKRASVPNDSFARVSYTEAVDSMDALRYAMEDISSSSLYTRERNIAKYDNLNHKKVILEFMIESAIMFKEKSDDEVDYYMQELSDTESEITALEWEENGEPNAVIKDHIMTKKDKEKEADEKAKKEAEEKKKKIESEKIIKVSNRVKELRKNAVELAEKTVSDMDGKISCHISSSDRNKFIAGEENSICLGGFGNNEAHKSVIRELRDAFSDDENFTISDDNYFTVYINAVKGSEVYCEDGTRLFIIPNSYEVLYEAEEISTKGDKDDEKEPVKDKEDLSTRIQNKALDHDAKRLEKKAIKDEKHGKLKNAGKAITAGPRGWIDSVKRFGSNFDKMDENRRKKFFLKPGFRHRIFKNLKVAFMYGAAAQAKLTLIPVVAVCRHFSKDKDRRIRTELVRELDNEIKICEEKINDANSNGEQQEKYKLMRIKGKLESEKNRVALNSKFI